MKKLVLTLLGIGMSAGMAIGQVCSPDPNAVDEGDPGEIWPPEFQVAYTCTSSYAQDITAIVPATVNELGFDLTVIDYTINTVSGLPPGFTFSCNPATCVYPGGTSGCVVVAGDPSAVATGSYAIIADITASVQLPPLLGGGVLAIDSLYPFELIVADCGDCATLDAPTNPQSLNLPADGRYQLTWSPVQGSVGYRVSGGPIPALGNASPQLGEFNTTFLVPYAQLVSGATYRWGVRAGCGSLPVPNLTPLSTFDTFASPTLRQGQFQEDIAEISSISLFPNPVTELVVLEINSDMAGDAAIRVMNMDGAVVMTERAQLGEGMNVVRYDVDLAPGLYILELEQASGSLTRKFTVGGPVFFYGARPLVRSGVRLQGVQTQRDIVAGFLCSPAFRMALSADARAPLRRHLRRPRGHLGLPEQQRPWCFGRAVACNTGRCAPNGRCCARRHGRLG
jgi:hypothetical protein